MSEAGASPCYYLVGPAGFPNYGDELIALTWLRHLAEIAPDADVYLDTHSPGPALALFGGVHPKLRFVDTLWRLCWHAPSDEPWELAEWIQRAVADHDLAPRWEPAIRQLARVDVVHVLGGGYINSIWPRHIGLLAAAVAVTRRSGGRAAMTGQGLVPESADSGELLRALADRFDVVEVRDEASAQLLGRPQAVGVDDVFLGMQRDGVHPVADAPPYMLCLQSDLVDAGLPRLAGFALATLRNWGVRPDDVGVVEGIPGQDRALYELLRHELPGARFYSFSDVWNDGLPASPSQTWLSTRFHMHLVAASVGAAGVAVDVKPGYYTTKHRSLVDLGSRWSLVDDLGKPAPRPLGGGFEPRVLDCMQRQKREIARRIYEPAKVLANGEQRARRSWLGRR